MFTSVRKLSLHDGGIDMAIRKLYQQEPSFKLTVAQVLELRDCYGGEVTIDQLVKHIQGKKIHKCPKCNGTGVNKVKYNAYPTVLPDSGFVHDWKYKYVSCDLCNGEGYTEHEYKPKMVQDGWE